jgi:hypothetical protein
LTHTPFHVITKRRCPSSRRLITGLCCTRPPPPSPITGLANLMTKTGHVDRVQLAVLAVRIGLA